ncbi:hypothetical protein PCAR4_530008 [Paraburkholderia caribensis]|nr:hypothetical protein PCAR4_530008 [Paraburkholderia caribensis]
MRQPASFFNRSRIMTSLPANISPLRQRMIDDMRMRQLAPKTQDIYLHIVREFTRFLGRSPDTATVEDLRRYQLYLVDHGTSAISLNHAITGLKFFFTVTLDRPELMVRMHPVRVPRILPVVLSPDEVRRLIEAAGNLKHQTALSVAYGAGLRASEVVAEGHRRRQRTHDTAHRAGQGPSRPLRDALASAARAPACVVARGPCAGQDARWRVAVSRARSARSVKHATVEPCHSCRRRGCQHRQARVHAHAATQLCDTSARTEGGHPRDPGAARPCEAREHRALRPGGHRPAARGHQSAGPPASRVGPRVAPHAGGCGHLPQPRASVAGHDTPEPGAAEGHVSHRTVPHGSTGRTCVALFWLRKDGGVLQPLSGPALPEVPGQRRPSLAAGTPGRSATRRVLPHRLHAARAHQRDCLV